jgi:K+-transporting ATPase ATPase C chain
MPVRITEADVRTQLRPAVILLALLTLLTGVLYPLVVTGTAQVLFPHQANGSLIARNNQALGSELVGQPFDDPRYFWGRPSAIGPYLYNTAASSGSNLGPSNPELLEVIQARITVLKAADPENWQPIPVDLVTASGSGLDPDISVAAALYQVRRVAKARGMSEDTVRLLVNQVTQGRQFGILGEPRINVLELNLALDGIK